MWNDKWSAEGLSLFGRANFDLGPLMAAHWHGRESAAARSVVPW